MHASPPEILLGDPCRRFARDAGCPVMWVPATAQLRAGTNVVLGYDLPTVSSVEAAVAGRLADALDSSLVVATQLQRYERHPVIVVPRRASLVGG